MPEHEYECTNVCVFWMDAATELGCCNRAVAALLQLCTNVRMCVSFGWMHVYTQTCVCRMCACVTGGLCVFVYRIEIEIEKYMHKFKCASTYMHVFTCMHAQIVCLGFRV